MTTLQDNVNQLSELVRIYSNFLEIWKDKIPTEGSPVFNNGAPQLDFFCYASDRETVLAVVGDAFGREGWTRKVASYASNEFDWLKSVNGITIYIHYAEVVKLERPELVSSKEFPLALTETASA